MVDRRKEAKVQRLKYPSEADKDNHSDARREDIRQIPERRN
jgi:hypothetical protein